MSCIEFLTIMTVIEETKESQQVPCYMLESSKPVWGKELEDCAVVLGTNVLEGQGFNIVHQNRTVVKSEGQLNGFTEQKNSTSEMLAISLSHDNYTSRLSSDQGSKSSMSVLINGIL